MDKKINLFLAAAVFAAAIPGLASAKVVVGNDVVARQAIDGYSNFTVVDLNNPANKDGTLATFTYWALNANPFQFFLIDESNTVRWISDQITPAAVGLSTYKPGTPAAVKKGWNLGVYFVNSGAIAYGSDNGKARYSNNNSGQPNLNSPLEFVSDDNRRYSMRAESVDDATTTVETGSGNSATSTPSLTLEQSLAKKNECKDNGWEKMTDPAFANQGNCVAYYNQLALDHLEVALKMIANQIAELIEKIKSLKK